MVPVKGKFEGDKEDFILNLNYTISEKYQFMSQSEFNKLAKKIDCRNSECSYW